MDPAVNEANFQDVHLLYYLKCVVFQQDWLVIASTFLDFIHIDELDLKEQKSETKVLNSHNLQTSKCTYTGGKNGVKPISSFYYAPKAALM